MNLTTAKRSPADIKEIMAYYEANGLEKLIDEKIKVYHADKIELKVRPETIDKRISEIKSQYPNEADFTKEIVSQGMTLTDLRKKILDQFKSYYVEQIEVQQKVFISPQQVNEYYQKNLDQIRVPEGVLLDSIFFPYENKKFLVQKQANEALATIKDPLKFAQYPKGLEDVAQRFSGVFATNTIHKEESLPEIEKAISKLGIGEISPLVPIKEGIYIFKIKERIPEAAPLFAEVKDKIYNFLFQKQLEEQREEWLKKLKDDAFIEIRH
jgi:parvulin-like peptidyl-prolyl isomerase